MKIVSPDLLAQFSEKGFEESQSSLYFSSSWLIRNVFWLRLRVILFLIKVLQKRRKWVLDFGGGNGAFLPTLSAYFEKVISVDLNQKDAQKLVSYFGLSNVELIEKDICSGEGLKEWSFDAIIAADVLEHFKDPQKAIHILQALLCKEGGYLYVSLPTENFMYVILRKIFGFTKPDDHYFNSKAVERMLQKSGMECVRHIWVPFGLNIFSLFSITVWRHGSNK